MAKEGRRNLVIPDEEWGLAQSEAKRRRLSVSALVRLGIRFLKANPSYQEGCVPQPKYTPEDVRQRYTPPTQAADRRYTPQEEEDEEDEFEESTPDHKTIYGVECPLEFISSDLYGNYSWTYKGWRYKFYKHKKDEWLAAIQAIKSVGDPERNPGAWENLNPVMRSWLEPKKEEV